MLWTLLLIPALGGLLCYGIASDRLRRVLLVFTAIGHFATVATMWAQGLEDPRDHWLGVDFLSLLFLLITSVLFTASAVYATSYLARHRHSKDANRRFSREAVFTGSLLVFLATMTLAIVSRHFGIFWMAIEATTLASAPLICYQRSDRSLEAAWKYLLICSVGIALALIGNIALAVSVAFVPSLHNMPLTFGALTAHADSLQPVWLKAAFVFFLVGYGTKMGLCPMHTWLPDAHSEAPSPVSALLSGALLNCAFLGILRINCILFKAGLGPFSNQLLVVFGLLSMFLAGWFIVQQVDFKRLLAYSSIEHMGILALAAGAGGPVHFGALLHAVNHSLTKGMLFLIAGNILTAYHTKSTWDVRGLVRLLPFSGVLWIAGFLAICGVPPFGTFVSEVVIMTGLARAQHWWLLSLMLLALGIIFVGMARVVIPMAYGKPLESMTPSIIGHDRLWCDLPPLVLCAALLILGCSIPQPFSRLVEQAAFIIGAH